MIDQDDLYQFAKLDVFTTFRVTKHTGGEWRVHVPTDKPGETITSKSMVSLASAIASMFTMLEKLERDREGGAKRPARKRTKVDRAMMSFKRWARRDARQRTKDGWGPAGIDAAFVNGWFFGYDDARRLNLD